MTWTQKAHQAGVFLTIGSGFVIPISTSLTGLFATLALVCWFLAGHFKTFADQVRSNPLVRAALLLFLVLVVGLIYTSAPFADAGHMLKKYRELLFLMVFISFLTTERYRALAQQAFALAMVVSLIPSMAAAIPTTRTRAMTATPVRMAMPVVEGAAWAGLLPTAVTGIPVRMICATRSMAAAIPTTRTRALTATPARKTMSVAEGAAWADLLPTAMTATGARMTRAAPPRDVSTRTMPPPAAMVPSAQTATLAAEGHVFPDPLSIVVMEISAPMICVTRSPAAPFRTTRIHATTAVPARRTMSVAAGAA